MLQLPLTTLLIAGIWKFVTSASDDTPETANLYGERPKQVQSDQLHRKAHRLCHTSCLTSVGIINKAAARTARHADTLTIPSKQTTHHQPTDQTSGNATQNHMLTGIERAASSGIGSRWMIAAIKAPTLSPMRRCVSPTVAVAQQR